jgi:hypothetical protein
MKSNFAGLSAALAKLGRNGADIILADLGVSCTQLDTPDRGFSTKAEGPLDADGLEDTADGEFAFFTREALKRGPDCGGEIGGRGKAVCQDRSEKRGVGFVRVFDEDVCEFERGDFWQLLLSRQATRGIHAHVEANEEFTTLDTLLRKPNNSPTG